MSEEVKDINKEAEDLAYEAQSAKVFNLSDVIKGRGYPKKDVAIYLDDEAAMRLVEVNNELDYTVEGPEFDALEKEAADLRQQIEASSLVFSLRGVNQDAIESVLKQTNIRHGYKKGQEDTENTEWLRDYITMLVGINITSVTTADGRVDSEAFDFNRADELRRNIPASEWGKLVEMMQKLTLAGGYFDQLTDAGFLQKS